MSDGGEMHPDLVRAPRLERHRQLRGVLVACHHLVVGARLATARADRHAGRVAHGAPDRSVDRAVRGFGLAGHDRVVPTLDVVGGQRADETGVRLRRAGHDEQAARLTVEAVHDPGSLRIAHRGEVVARQQRVDERALAVPGPRMDHDARGLVDDHDGVVLVHDGERHRRVRLRERRGRRCPGPRELVPRLEPGTARDDATVDRHRLAFDERAHLTARPAGEQREGPVDALARERLRHDDRRDNTRCRVVTVAAAHTSSARGRPASGSGAGFRKLTTIRRIAPIVIAESATLKDGNEPTRTKSTT